MRRIRLSPPWRLATMAVAAIGLATAEAQAIEMFTFFGDGSRIGLPSLEVPVEAYPGIPLRSDRLRARRRAMRLGPGTAVRIGPPGYARGMTVRAMPPAGRQARPAAAHRPSATPVDRPTGDPQAVEAVPPPAPEPDDVTLPPARP